jgi:cellulose biosynthesis protein BcsQ
MVISIASQKGGTGKTSTSISLSAGLAHKGKRVLLIDIDSQANSSKVLLHDYPKIPKDQTMYTTIIDRQPLPVHQTQVANLSIVPSHILLSNTDIELTTAKDHREARLKTELDKIKEHYDFVFIDNPPALGWLTLNSFTASHKVLNWNYPEATDNFRLSHRNLLNCSLLVVRGAQITQRRVTPHLVVEPLDVLEDCRPGCRLRAEAMPVEKLCL